MIAISHIRTAKNQEGTQHIVFIFLGGQDVNISELIFTVYLLGLFWQEASANPLAKANF